MSLSDHVDDEIKDEARSGSGHHACALIHLLLHRRKNGTATLKPIVIADLLPDPGDQAIYRKWVAAVNDEDAAVPVLPADVIKLIEYTPSVAGGDDGGGADDAANGQLPGGKTGDPASDDPTGYALGLYATTVTRFEGAPVTFGESPVASLAGVMVGSEESDLRELALEATQRERALRSDEERARMLSRDPLGIRPDHFDLRSLEAGRQASLRKLSTTAPAGSSAQGGASASVLPTDPEFSPLLFLTLVHPKASFDELTTALEELQKVSQSHAGRLQRLVRDNFPLFVRCAEGIDFFEKNVGLGGNSGGNNPSSDLSNDLDSRLAKLSSLASSCSSHASKAFRPLLDNTDEIRRTKNAITTLSRVGPILAVPNLMRGHLTAGRIADAVKAYRRIRLITESCGVELLKSVREAAMEAAKEARASLVKVMGSCGASTQQLLVAIRDMNDLGDLENEGEAGLAFGSPNPRAGGAGPGTDMENHSLVCLVAQAKHFAQAVAKVVQEYQSALQECAHKDAVWKEEGRNAGGGARASVEGVLESDGESDGEMHDDRADTDVKENKGRQSSAPTSLKSSVCGVRVHTCVAANSVASVWMPRLMRIASAAYEKQGQLYGIDADMVEVKVGDVLQEDVSKSLIALIKVVGQCALGDDSFTATFAALFPSSLAPSLCPPSAATPFCKAPLPPSANSKGARCLADLSATISACSASSRSRTRLPGEASTNMVSQLSRCAQLVEVCVMETERRWTKAALEHCARGCEVAASNGVIDLHAIQRCLEKLHEDLNRGYDCGEHVVKGVKGCVEGICRALRRVLGGSGKEQDMSTSLRVCCECARSMGEELEGVKDAVSKICAGGDANNEARFEKSLEDLEKEAWESCLASIRESVEIEVVPSVGDGFPVWLAGALMEIVKCRARLEDVFSGDVRRGGGDGITYLYLGMQMASIGVLECVVRGVGGLQDVGEEEAQSLFVGLEFLLDGLGKFIVGEKIEVKVRELVRGLRGVAGAGKQEEEDNIKEDMRSRGGVLLSCLQE